MRRFWLLMALAACAQGGADAPKGRVAQALHEAPLAYYVVLTGPPAARVAGDLKSPAARRRVRRHLAALASDRAVLRPQLLAAGATIVAELSRVANAFHVHMTPSAARRVASFAGVLRVEPVPTFTRELGTAIPTVGAPAAWGVPFTGQGVRLGIIDTGIDYLHADFGGSGIEAEYDGNDRSSIEPGSFPTARVVGGFDFAGDAYDPSGGAMNPTPDPDPLDCGGHGSHVAGIAAGGGVLADGTPFAGPYTQSFVPSAFRIAPGVAPEASLYAIKIFGCSGSTQLFASGLEWAADPNQDGDMSDRLDVVNASLGTSFGVGSPLTDSAIESLASLGTLVVAAAGNEGATFFALSSPARVPAVLSVAASVDTGLVNLEVTAPSSVAGDLPAVEAAFSPSLAGTGPISGDLVAADPFLACDPLSGDLTGKVAFIERGSCTFLEKFGHAEAAGAVAVVVANDEVNEPPFAMQGSGNSTVPGVMISAVDGQTLASATGVTVSLSAEPFDGPGAEFIAGLSSRGPSTSVGAKPEISAPGVQIASVGVGTGSEADNQSGTSMASPFVAGAAVLVRQAFPSLSAAGVKAVLMNSAAPIGDGAGAIYPITMQGSGRLDVAAAVTQTITLSAAEVPEAVGVSFGAFVVDAPVEATRTVHVRNHGTATVSLTLAAEQIHALDGVTVSVNPKTIEVPSGGEALVTLTLSIDPEVLGDPDLDPVTPPLQFDLPRHALAEADGVLLATGTATTMARLPFYAVVRAAGEQTLGPITSCGETALIEIEGASAHPRPVISAFSLGVEDTASALEEPDLDLRAIGAASNAATELFEEATVYFALVTEGAWATPAIAVLPLVGVEVDVDDDDNADYLIVPEPLGHNPPYADVLAATTYDVRDCNGFDLNQCQQIEQKRYLNGLPADVAPTHPYFNGALVLPVYAVDLGLTEDASSLKYRAVSRTLTGTADQTDWASFDVLAPAIDTTAGGIREGLPFFENVVRLSGSGPLLVIHHANVIGKHWEIVQIDPLGGAPLELAIDGPETIAPGQLLVATVALDNVGASDLSHVVIELSADGGVIESVTAPTGICGGTSCTIESLPAGAHEEIAVELFATSDVHLETTVTTSEGCSDSRSLEVALATPSPAPRPALVPSGGCGCRVDGSGTSPPRAPLGGIGIGIALALARRLRRTS